MLSVWGRSCYWTSVLLYAPQGNTQESQPHGLTDAGGLALFALLCQPQADPAASRLQTVFVLTPFECQKRCRKRGKDEAQL